MAVKTPLKRKRRPAARRAAHGQRRGDLLAAGLECFSRSGVEGTTVEAILDHCGASIGSLYQHYAGKDGLAAALYLQGTAAYKARARALFEAATTAEDGVKALVRAYFDCVEADPKMAAFLMQGRSYLDQTHHAAEIDQGNQEFLQQTGKWFREQIRAGQLRPLPAEYVLAIIEGPARHYARRWIDGRATQPIAEAREILAQAAWDALRYLPAKSSPLRKQSGR